MNEVSKGEIGHGNEATNENKEKLETNKNLDRLITLIENIDAADEVYMETDENDIDSEKKAIDNLEEYNSFENKREIEDLIREVRGDYPMSAGIMLIPERNIAIVAEDVDPEYETNTTVGQHLEKGQDRINEILDNIKKEIQEDIDKAQEQIQDIDKMTKLLSQANN